MESISKRLAVDRNMLSSKLQSSRVLQIHAVSTAKQEMAKKHPKIIVRLNMSAGKKKSSKV